jgi:hypothetical protein
VPRAHFRLHRLQHHGEPLALQCCKQINQASYPDRLQINSLANWIMSTILTVLRVCAPVLYLSLCYRRGSGCRLVLLSCWSSMAQTAGHHGRLPLATRKLQKGCQSSLATRYCCYNGTIVRRLQYAANHGHSVLHATSTLEFGCAALYIYRFALVTSYT